MLSLDFSVKVTLLLAVTQQTCWYTDVIMPALQTFFSMFDICSYDIISTSLARTPFELQTSSGCHMLECTSCGHRERVMKTVKTASLFRDLQLCKPQNMFLIYSFGNFVEAFNVLHASGDTHQLALSK